MCELTWFSQWAHWNAACAHSKDKFYIAGRWISNTSQTKKKIRIWWHNFWFLTLFSYSMCNLMNFKWSRPIYFFYIFAFLLPRSIYENQGFCNTQTSDITPPFLYISYSSGQVREFRYRLYITNSKQSFMYIIVVYFLKLVNGGFCNTRFL